uniref:Uncharacterized protein n=1 Tax=Anopheles melas TaxID=34690 RepID=A0A182U5S0_9DIPT
MSTRTGKKIPPPAMPGVPFCPSRPVPFSRKAAAKEAIKFHRTTVGRSPERLEGPSLHTGHRSSACNELRNSTPQTVRLVVGVKLKMSYIGVLQLEVVSHLKFDATFKE